MTAPTGRGAVLAVDVGGTAMKGAVVRRDGTVLAQTVTPTPPGGGPAAVDALRVALAGLRDRAAGAGEPVVAAGVVTPGIVDEESGTVCYASNLGWRDVPLSELISGDLDRPVAIGHDVRAAGLAESLVGVARACRHFVQVPIGTGIAAAVISGGRMITGVGGAAGELGHIPVHPGGEACRCGQAGCLEVYASAAAVARRYRRFGGTAPGDAAQVVALLGTDRVADAVWRDAVEALALGLATVTLLLDPELVVLGGGLSRAGATLAEPVLARLREHLTWRPAPRLEISALGSVAGRTGAAVLAMRAADRESEVAGWVRGAPLTSPRR